MPTLKYVPRAWNPLEGLDRKSILLLGPRQTGKSSLIRHALKGTRVYNLLDSSDVEMNDEGLWGYNPVAVTCAELKMPMANLAGGDGDDSGYSQEGV